MSRLISPSGAVTQGLDLVRPMLSRAKLREVTAALAVYDGAVATWGRLIAAGTAARQEPHERRRAHHSYVVARVLAGQPLDDVDAWLTVEAADAAVPLAEARVAAANIAVERAAVALHEALNASWASLLRLLATERAKGITPAVEALYTGFSWPALVSDAPGVETPLPIYQPPQGGNGHIPEGLKTTQVSRWWPLDLDPEGPHYFHRAERRQWNVWAWQQLAEGRYHSDADARTIAFRESWSPTVNPSPYGSESERIALISPIIATGLDGLVHRR